MGYESQENKRWERKLALYAPLALSLVKTQLRFLGGRSMYFSFKICRSWRKKKMAHFDTRISLGKMIVVALGENYETFSHIHEYIIFQILFPFRLLYKYWAEFLMLYSRSQMDIHFKYRSVYMSILSFLTAPSTHFHSPCLHSNHTFVL